MVDGRSEDKTTVEVLKFKDKLPKLTILTDQERNVSIQRNNGAKKANGDWIIFIDADDRLPRFFLEGIKYRIAQSNIGERVA